jgi:hypothetical protein
MVTSRLPLTAFERVLLRVAIVLGATLVLVRLGAMIALPYLHHTR